MNGVGIIGCGNISAAYLRLGPLFQGFEIRAVADVSMAAAKARATEFAVRAETVKGLLAATDIGVIVNLTVPDAHFRVTRNILQAGKHAYTEKPLVLNLREAEVLRSLATAKGLRVGSAPDTFLGGAHQLARAAIDEGQVGKIIAGSCHVMGHGMEHWHPNPDFFFRPGGGPMLDHGPYYVTNLIQLLGPVRRVAALATASFPTRTISSQPRAGEVIPVTTPTNIHALLDFASGATITLSTSWDIWAHNHPDTELYGTEGSIFVPDPNFFGGTVSVARPDGTVTDLAGRGHPFGVPNQDERANYRTAGLADMVAGIAAGRPHRCSLDLAIHAVDVMTATLKSGKTGRFVTLTTTCERPEPLDPEAARALLK